MKKLLVAANCQTTGLTKAFRMLMPEWDCVTVSHTQVLDPQSQPAMMDLYRSVDLVITQPWGVEFGEFAAARVANLNPRVIYVPPLEYAGFHPDLTYILMADGKALQSPLMDYNSVIAVAGYLAGVGVSRLPALYNSHFFARLGYFDVAEASRAACIRDFTAWGYDIEPLFQAWQRRGTFMHSVNHPKIWALADVARMVCEKHELGTIHDISYGDLLADDLVHGPVYPVFPEIARRLGIAGASRSFKTSAWTETPRERVIDLREFVASCYEMFGQTDRSSWQLPPRVSAAVELLAEYAQ